MSGVGSGSADHVRLLGGVDGEGGVLGQQEVLIRQPLYAVGHPRDVVEDVVVRGINGFGGGRDLAGDRGRSGAGIRGCGGRLGRGGG